MLVGYNFNNEAKVQPFINLEYGLNRKGQVFGVNLGMRYQFIENFSFDLSLSQSNLYTFDNIYANKFMLLYGIIYRL